MVFMGSVAKDNQEAYGAYHALRYSMAWSRHAGTQLGMLSIWFDLFGQQTGWWLSHPSEKYESSGMTFPFPTEWENKSHVPNHQLVNVYMTMGHHDCNGKIHYIFRLGHLSFNQQQTATVIPRGYRSNATFLYILHKPPFSYGFSMFFLYFSNFPMVFSNQDPSCGSPLAACRWSTAHRGRIQVCGGPRGVPV